MPGIALTYPELKALHPCTADFKRVAKLLGGATKWDNKKVSAKKARAAGATFQDIMWTASALAKKHNPDVERRMQLWLADCAAHVLHLYESTLPKDNRPRDAIGASRAYARGTISVAALSAASAAARTAAWSATWDAVRDTTWDAARAAEAAAWAAARAAEAAAWAAGRGVEAVAWAAARGAEAAARADEELWQFDRLILWLSPHEPVDWPIYIR